MNSLLAALLGKAVEKTLDKGIESVTKIQIAKYDHATSKSAHETQRHISDNTHSTIWFVSFLLFIIGLTGLGVYYFTRTNEPSPTYLASQSQVSSNPEAVPQVPPVTPPSAGPLSSKPTRAHKATISSAPTLPASEPSQHWLTRAYRPHFDGWYVWLGKYLAYLVGFVFLLGVSDEDAGCTLGIIGVLFLGLGYWI